MPEPDLATIKAEHASIQVLGRSECLACGQYHATLWPCQVWALADRAERAERERDEARATQNPETDRNLTVRPTGQVSGHARVDAAAVKAVHSQAQHWCCGRPVSAQTHGWPCEPFLLAVEVERLAGKVARVEALCDGREAFAREHDALARFSTRDVRAALADQPGRG